MEGEYHLRWVKILKNFNFVPYFSKPSLTYPVLHFHCCFLYWKNSGKHITLWRSKLFTYFIHYFEAHFVCGWCTVFGFSVPTCSGFFTCSSSLVSLFIVHCWHSVNNYCTYCTSIVLRYFCVLRKPSSVFEHCIIMSFIAFYIVNNLDYLFLENMSKTLYSVSVSRFWAHFCHGTEFYHDKFNFLFFMLS